MNGRVNGPLPEIVTTDWFVTDKYEETQTNIGANSDYEADITIPKKEGYRLFGIGGFDLGRTSGTRYFYFKLYRAAITVGDGETDTISIGMRNDYTSSGAAHAIILKLIYIREDWT